MSRGNKQIRIGVHGDHLPAAEAKKSFKTLRDAGYYEHYGMLA
jgi:hypothetical protein